MKAAVLQAWKAIDIQDRGVPTPGPGEVLIKVSFTGICGSDVHIFNGTNPIARTPVIPGHEFSGRVAAIGEGVSGFEPGTRAAIQPLKFCGTCTACKRDAPHVCERLIVIGVNQDGGFAEHVVVPAECVFPIPDSLSDETAALAEPFSIATHSLNRGRISQTDRVLVIGAGPIGLYCALTAQYMGARLVQISEPNAERRAVAEALGVATTDPTQAGALDQLAKASDGEGFDLVVETSGTTGGFETATQAASVQGRIVSLGFPGEGHSQIHITRCIIKELSLIGSRVCTRSEFRDTLDMLTTMQAGDNVDLEGLISSIRPLSELATSIVDVERGTETAKILIKPI
ncbi:Zn-dependent alcohol dehydrogenase [Phaeobacter inhibens]|uniref:zinc-dependent alcohol dehydrogenase n=1 Tax=Phaeobacter inhibens TaxID=221822 RepID=UPI00276660D1|nr:alcohol dehydrogenase catalytic domain-containing protein [Phaeobacter inhibens]GLO72791.1 Zn-dependent alcohol dehydrogenase [Phaeobacter inhibens]